jgi:hypothetical protein
MREGVVELGDVKKKEERVTQKSLLSRTEFHGMIDSG